MVMRFVVSKGVSYFLVQLMIDFLKFSVSFRIIEFLYFYFFFLRNDMCFSQMYLQQSKVMRCS